MIRTITRAITRPIIRAIRRAFEKTRYLINLNGTNAYYELAQPITFAGDFEVECECLSHGTGQEEYIAFDDSGALNYMRLDYLNNSIDIVMDGTFYNLDGGSVFIVGALNTVGFSRIGSTLKTFLNGIETHSVSGASLNAITYSDKQSAA